MSRTVIIGAGIAGISAAYHLAIRAGRRDVILIDEREPLTLTSDKGTWGYRNWWPGPDDTMCRFVSRSIELLEGLAEESNDAFALNRRGYLFVTSDPTRVEEMRVTAHQVSSFGMGPVREHGTGGVATGSYAPAPPSEWRGQPTGADLLVGDDAVLAAFPYLALDSCGALHVRRAGTLEASLLGHWMLERAISAGVRLVRDRVTGIPSAGGRVNGVELLGGTTLACDEVVIAAGPLLDHAGRMLGLELPVFHELHAKLTLRDPARAVPRGAPFVISLDPMVLPWSDEERAQLARAEETRSLVAPFPGGVHVRPVDRETGTELFYIWTYDAERRAFSWPPVFDPWYGEVCVRGASRLVPGLAVYRGGAGLGTVDGGYYCKTIDNRPLIGPLPVEGAYALGALSGYGVMASASAAELLALHLEGAPLPPYAAALLPSRFDDPAYEARVAAWSGSGGQL